MQDKDALGIGLLGAIIPEELISTPSLWGGPRLEMIERRILRIERALRTGVALEHITLEEKPDA